MEKMNLMKKVLCGVSVMGALYGCCGGSGPQYTASIPEGFDALCRRAIDEWKVPGMAVAVVKDGKTVFLKGYGLASVEENIPVEPDTRFVIASTSKAFTAALLANVMDQYDTIRWEEPVKNYLPDFRLYDPWVTEEFRVRDIMVHKTGFNAYATDDLPFFGYDREELYHLLAEIRPTYSFRTKYAYNNQMYGVAARIIEKYTGKSWDEALAERIFRPLEMKNSTTGDLSFYTAEKLAKGYRLSKAPGKDSVVVRARDDREDAFTWLSAVAPAGFVISTAEDMSHWLKMHLAHGEFNGKEVISRKNHDYLFYPQTITGCDSARLINYAQGWTVEQGELGRYIRHTGLAYGYTALVGLVPDLDLGFVFLTNNGTDSDAQSALARDLIALYRGVENPGYFDEYLADFHKSLFSGKKKEEAASRDSLPALRAEAYTGRYDGNGFGTARVYLKNDSLFFALKKVDSYLRHKSGNTFVFRVPGAGSFDLDFFTDRNGRVHSLTFDIGDPVGPFRRR